jgi:peptidoglycan/xylan/chitin deacetylase (PgdA/CDA1 family)
VGRRFLALLPWLLPVAATAQTWDGQCPDGKPRNVALTFDDGPHNPNTLKVLAALADPDGDGTPLEKPLPATFFVIGDRLVRSKDGGLITKPENLAKNREILRAITAAGHPVGTHTFHHTDHTNPIALYEACEDETKRRGIPESDPRACPWIGIAALREQGKKPSAGQMQKIDARWEELMKRNIADSLAPLRDVTQLSPVLRLPYGAGSFRSSDPAKQKRNDRILEEIKNQGFAHVGWDVDTQDWRYKDDTDAVLRSIRDELCATSKGGIVLFHDMQESTARNLPLYLRVLSVAGHRFVPVDDAGLDHPAPPLPAVVAAESGGTGPLHVNPDDDVLPESAPAPTPALPQEVPQQEEGP